MNYLYIFFLYKICIFVHSLSNSVLTWVNTQKKRTVIIYNIQHTLEISCYFLLIIFLVEPLECFLIFFVGLPYNLYLNEAY